MNTWVLWEYLTPEDQKKLRALAPPDWKPPKSPPVRHEKEDIEEIARLLKEPGHIERGKDW